MKFPSNYQHDFSGFTEDQIWEFYHNLCSKNLRLILTMSPIGSKISQRSRDFPGLINCCTIIWLKPWSSSSLSIVARDKIRSDKKNSFSDQEVENISDFLMQAHCSVARKADDYGSISKQKIYITPKNYLDLIEKFLSINIEKIQENKDQVFLFKFISFCSKKQFKYKKSVKD